MEKQLQTNTEISKLKEIIKSFKHIGTIEKNSEEEDCIWYSENFPEYRIIYHKKIHNSTYELQENKSWKLFETSVNKAGSLLDVARVLIADCKTHNTPEYRSYTIKSDEAVLVPSVSPEEVQDVVSKEEIEYYKKHPVDIAKERFCYITLKKDLGDNRLFSKVLPAVLKALPEYEREDWIDKTYNIHPCEGKECPYHWCCIRHEVKSVRKYNKMKYCL
jgi:hypothetical protein